MPKVNRNEWQKETREQFVLPQTPQAAISLFEEGGEYEWLIESHDQQNLWNSLCVHKDFLEVIVVEVSVIHPKYHRKNVYKIDNKGVLVDTKVTHFEREPYSLKPSRKLFLNVEVIA